MFTMARNIEHLNDLRLQGVGKPGGVVILLETGGSRNGMRNCGNGRLGGSNNDWTVKKIKVIKKKKRWYWRD